MGKGQQSMNIRDVAQRAGVSVATVSRVLNHPDKVTEKTKNKVLSVIKTMDYQPNWFARGLNVGQTGVIALLIPNILNPIYTEVAKGVEEVAHERGHYTLLCNSEDSLKKEKAYVNMLLHRKVEGLIFVAGHLHKECMEKIIKESLPSVAIGKESSDQIVTTVYTDYKEGAFQATKHLIENGRLKVAHLCGNLKFEENKQKYEGYRKALNEHGIKLNDEWICQGRETIESGYLAAKRIIGKKQRPDGIFAANDLMAFGAMEAIRTENMRIPKDMALVGYGNVPMAPLVTPKLTTVSVPAYKMGLMAGRLLIDAIEKTTFQKSQHIFLPSTLKVRQSCAKTNRIDVIFNK